ncbi:MAG: ribosome maturation factor RimP [Clostridia bacterium]|nr:ribosome maturation factor RimP [Clostridia bacterium]
MKVKPVEEIKDFLTPIGNEIGVEVVEVEFKQGKSPALTVYIDREGGIDLDICEKFHRAIDEPLDELDPTFGQPYTLNCSSLGLDRPFKSVADFERNIGKEVEVKLYSAIAGKKYYEGVLVDAKETSVVIKVDEKTVLSIEKSSIAKINRLITID